MYLVVNIKTGPLLFVKSEITQSSDTFSSSGTLQPLKICISGQFDFLHNVNVINSNHRLVLRHISPCSKS